MNKSNMLIALMAGILLSATAMAEVVVIGHPDHAGDALSAEELRDIYLGKSNRFPNGDPVKPIDQRSGSDARNQFLEQVMEKTESEMNRYWSRLIFSGKKRPPEVLESGDAVKRWVARNPDGVGYIDASNVDDSVKVLLRLQ